MSPFLFTPVVESKGWAYGRLNISRNKVSIRHLQFADDIFFFTSGHDSKFLNLVKEVGVFCDINAEN